MTNELIFFMIALIDFTFIQVVFRFGKPYVFAVIILNILLISVFGAKLIEIFGFTTNIGNVFYAAVFFAAQLLVEGYGKKEAYNTIWLGVVSVVFFILMAQFVIFTIGIPETRVVNSAIDDLFQAAPRVAIASIFAYIISQAVNISLFSYLKAKTGGKYLYLRVNLTNIVGQAIDSLIFFSIAFFGVIPFPTLVQVMLIGYGLKVFAGALSTPFFYLLDSKKPSV
ncbi:hypothetical protein A3C59_04225 [Candidatus Daviesbacteria bacterium RIFCSPHIGHO2_02_FULL_36_13]|uniref:Probable queuosine precursor transporter n=1 Tax=Candidatus Daviesbacteria bacterium RIFCSPHIGHO2_02_FULL_36_13 TaxID=1797768 RepID=A0A1F5JUD6_9BACT|nr:MAG: hypothetical protein A3C59_04225 [Candidatus Daviesbacteria bacterium RIFCSPHIGHO2_02_FULL_36_13]OGE44330.1 MAG: hypothetical protein A3A45_03880 [Candidatus Daviesbacteria bacterium RIFCSPLOWO2_01_FULL_36_8]